MAITLKKQISLLKKEIKKLKAEIEVLLNGASRTLCPHCDNLDCDGTPGVCDFHSEKEN